MVSNERLVMRTGQQEDFHSIMMLIKDHLDELGIPKTDNVLRYCLNLITRALNYDHTVIGVIGPIDNVQGYIILSIFEDGPSGEDILGECGLFLKKELRPSPFKYQKEMLSFAKSTAKELNMKLRLNVDLNRPRKNAYLRLLKRNFGDPTHISYTWDPAL